MWGDPHQLTNNSPLHSLLIQISGPGHIPREDLRWSDLFHHYDVLVHLEEDFQSPSAQSEHPLPHESRHYGDKSISNVHVEPNFESTSRSILVRASAEMFKHCCHSSNLAALALHVSRMIRDLEISCWDLCWNKVTMSAEPASSEIKKINRGNVQHSTMNASATIALVGRARVTAGVLNLLRVMIHPIMVRASKGASHVQCSSERNTYVEYLKEAFTYKSRGDHSFMFHTQSSSHHLKSIDAATELICALLSFISMAGNGKTCFIPKMHDYNNFEAIGRQVSDMTQSIPEIYDVIVLSLSLLLTLTSSQLYQPMTSSMQWLHDTGLPSDVEPEGFHFFLDTIMRLAGEQPIAKCPQYLESTQQPDIRDTLHKSLSQKWSAQSVLSACLHWFIYRPAPPLRSIAAHHSDLVSAVIHDIHVKTGNSSLASAATSTGLISIGVDGMYETHTIVSACVPSKTSLSGVKSTLSMYKSPSGLLQDSDTRPLPHVKKTSLHSSLYDLSSSLLLLPIRLLKLALAVILRHQRSLLPIRLGYSPPSSFDLEKILSMKSAVSSGHLDHEPITNDVLWQSDSVVADFACAFFLLLTNNYRARLPPTSEKKIIQGGHRSYRGNPFRTILAVLDDHRWESLLDREGAMVSENRLDPDSRLVPVTLQSKTTFTVDFELLFQRFISVIHNEMGSLTLYTLFLSSPIVTTSFLVRSDLEALALPLLRTLYMSMTIHHHYSGRTTTLTHTEANVESVSTSVHVLQRPFRSSSHLYVLLILLLIFSQDSSFGPDSFRRTSIESVSWYKERNLKDISLGSLLILILLRCITFNINRLQDPFLLSNACAVLLNLSPHMYNLHPYSAMRLASVTVSSMKKYAVLCAKKGGVVDGHDGQDILLGMHAELSRCLVNTVKNGLRSSVLESNLHLVYSLVYLQRDFHLVTKVSKSPFEMSDIAPLQNVISRAYEVIRAHSSRSADEALALLRDSIELWNPHVESNGQGSVEGDEEFSFIYEEESDPEIFFLPYVWEVIVCVISSSIIDWDKKNIKIFPLLTGLSSHGDDVMADDSKGYPDLISNSDVAELV